MDIFTTLKDEQGNNVYPDTKLYYHKVTISGADIESNDLRATLYFTITAPFNTEFTKNSFIKFIQNGFGAIGNIHSVLDDKTYTDIYCYTNEDDTQVIVECDELDSSVTLNYQASGVFFEDEVIPL